MTRSTHWLCIILLILCVSTVLVHQYRGRDRDIWPDHESQGTFRQRTVEVLTVIVLARKARTSLPTVGAGSCTAAFEVHS
jgi:type II secretory pathway component PulK